MFRIQVAFDGAKISRDLNLVGVCRNHPDNAVGVLLEPCRVSFVSAIGVVSEKRLSVGFAGSLDRPSYLPSSR